MNKLLRRAALVLGAPAAVGLAVAAGPAIGASAAPAAHAQAADSAVGDPGVYLSSTPTLTLAAPNVITAGKLAVLKTCLHNGDCTVFANDKVSETFDFVASTTTTAGTMLRVHGTTWCVTNRGTGPGNVFYETCHSYASQLWNGSGGVLHGVLQNVKTHLRLTHTAIAVGAPVQAAGSFTFWGDSS